jgi:serine protease Do
LILFMVASSLFMYMMFTKQTTDFNQLDSKLISLQTDTQTKLNDLSTTVLDTRNGLTSLGSQIGSLDTELTKLKASASSDFSGIIDDAIKSVVTIKTNTGQGSGFIIASGGYVVTNEHVMEGVTAAIVITYDGQQHRVSLVGADVNMDVALLKMNSTGYNPIGLGDSNKVQLGEKVIVIGNPLGLQFSVSEGIVSAVHREGENKLNAYIQTDASLNPGNSGGPLINTEGKVVGMNNFKISNSENIGFALESNYIKTTVNDISQKSYGRNLI